MGQIIIEVPFDVSGKYKANAAVGNKVLQMLDELAALRVVNPNGKTPALELPTERHNDKDSQAVLGIWANRAESGEQIARNIRNRNNGKR